MYNLQVLLAFILVNKYRFHDRNKIRHRHAGLHFRIILHVCLLDPSFLNNLLNLYYRQSWRAISPSLSVPSMAPPNPTG